MIFAPLSWQRRSDSGSGHSFYILTPIILVIRATFQVPSRCHFVKFNVCHMKLIPVAVIIFSPLFHRVHLFHGRGKVLLIFHQRIQTHKTWLNTHHSKFLFRRPNLWREFNYIIYFRGWYKKIHISSTTYSSTVEVSSEKSKTVDIGHFRRFTDFKGMFWTPMGRLNFKI